MPNRIIVPQPYFEKPAEFIEPNFSHPHLAGCQGWYAFQEQGLPPDLMGVSHCASWAAEGTAPYVGTNRGLAIQGVPGNNAQGPLSPINPKGWDEITMMVAFQLNTAFGSTERPFMRVNSFSGQGIALETTSNTNLRILIATDGTTGWSGAYDVTVTQPTDGEWYGYACTYKSGDRKVYFGSLGSETLADTETAITGSIAGGTEDTMLLNGRHNSNQRGVNANVIDLRIYNRALSEATVCSIFRNLWAPLERRILIPVGAVTGDTNVSANTDSLTLTEYQASVAHDINVSASTDSLTLTEQSATVSLNVNISASTDSLTLTTYQASIEAATGDTNVEANTDTLTLTEYQASIANDVNVSANTDSLTLTTYAATVVNAINVNANTDTLVLTENAATVTYDINVNASVDALTLTEYSATIGVVTPTQIDGASTKVINSAYGSVTLYNNGTDYYSI